MESFMVVFSYFDDDFSKFIYILQKLSVETNFLLNVLPNDFQEFRVFQNVSSFVHEHLKAFQKTPQKIRQCFNILFLN